MQTDSLTDRFVEKYLRYFTVCEFIYFLKKVKKYFVINSHLRFPCKYNYEVNINSLLLLSVYNFEQ